MNGLPWVTAAVLPTTADIYLIQPHPMALELNCSGREEVVERKGLNGYLIANFSNVTYPLLMKIFTACFEVGQWH